jgi:hypothetical protein
MLPAITVERPKSTNCSVLQENALILLIDFIAPRSLNYSNTQYNTLHTQQAAGHRISWSSRTRGKVANLLFRRSSQFELRWRSLHSSHWSNTGS